MPASAPTLDAGLESSSIGFCYPPGVHTVRKRTKTIVEEHGKVSAGEEKASDSGTARALNIAIFISDEEAVMLIDLHVRECPKDHAGIGLAIDMAGAKSLHPRIGVIRTIIKRIDECAFRR